MQAALGFAMAHLYPGDAVSSRFFHVAGMEERESERGESMFSFGCCLPGGPFDAGHAHRLAAMGFSYGEIAAAPLAAMTNEEFAALRREQQVGGLPIQAANCFLPGELSLFAPDQKEKLRGHVERVLHRAADLGIDTVVFGSEGARRIPKDTPREVGEDVIADFLTLCSRFCAQTGVTLVIEPLNKTECNVLNTVEEAARLARRLNLPQIRVLADAYHVFCEQEDFSVLSREREWLAHIHVAEPPGRMVPGADGGAYLACFGKALREAGYDGRVSIECRWEHFEAEMEQGLHFLKKSF